MRSLFLFLLLSGIVTGLHGAESHAASSPAERDLRKLKLAAGLKAEVFAAEPLLENPVCFSIDARGRFFVVETHRYRNSIFDITANTPWLLDDLSFRTVNDRAAFLSRTFVTNFAVLTNESELIRLVEDRDGDGRAETTSVFADGFRESISGTAAGVLAQGTNVWFTCIPDLWRFSTNPPLANRQSPFVNHLATGLGVHISVSGHDVHGLIRGHDGRIYFSFGDRGVCVTNREGVVLNVPDTGGVLRCEPDGRNLEIFCTGLRNPQELAFDDLGNLWTVDNDTAGADPCRVLHLVEGGDYGWRMSYQHMKGFGPWVSEEMWRGGLDGILPPAGIVSQGPAGLAFYPGTSLAPQLTGRFVHADFPGGVWAYSVKPRGASYELADKEKILWNCWPTDVDFGPDGALYVLDWVQGWSPPGKGRIYRLTSTTNAVNESEVAEVKRLLGEGMDKRSDKELNSLLSHIDRRVRLEAQWKLSSMTNYATLSQTAKNLRLPVLPRLHAIWALEQAIREIRMGSRQHNNVIFRAEMNSLITLLNDRETEVRAQACRLMASAMCGDSQESLRELFADPSLRVRMFALNAYAKLLQHRPLVAATITQPLLTRTREKAREAVKGNWGLTAKGFDYPGAELRQLLESNPSDSHLLHSTTTVLTELFKLVSPSALVEMVESSRTNARAYRVSQLLVLGRLGKPEVTSFFSDPDPQLVLEAARAINDAPIPAAYPALAALLEDPRFRDTNWGRAALSNITPAGPFSTNVRPPRDQVLLRALNANFRLGEPKNAEVLVRFAVGAPVSDPARSSNGSVRAGSETGAPIPSHLRAEALFLLGAWEVLSAKVGDLPIKPTKDPNHGAVPTVNPENWPGWFDRVVGFWRPLPPRPASDAQATLASHIAALLSDAAPEVAQAALNASVKLRLANAAPALHAKLRDRATPAAFRRQIVPALAALAPASLDEPVKLALADTDAKVRASALPFLNRMQGDDAARILGDIVAKETDPTRRSADNIPLAQAALLALGGIQSPASSSILATALTNLLGGTLPAELELDLLDAAARQNSPAVRSLLTRREAAFTKDDVLAGWRPALQGGDVERGRAVFFDKVEVQCARCHAVKGQGGIVGPTLDRISRQRSREQLLESVVFPNRAISPGYENVVITLRDGTQHAGLIKDEDDKEVRLESPEDGSVRIAKQDVVSRQRGLSAMPDGLAEFLGRRELRDLVEFLASLK